MALEGTLNDFGIAEILQLIGTQQKTGILFVEGTGETEEVQVWFRGGKVIRVETALRDKRDALGAMLVAAMVVTREQLQIAQATQKKTLQPIGDLLVEQGALAPEIHQEFVDLRTRETLYQLFHWKRGKYRFESKPPAFAKPTVTPISSESLLMEGVRMLDEWPLIRQRVSDDRVVFKAVKTIEESETEAEALERILDDAFSEFVDPTSPPDGSVSRGKKVTGAASNLTRNDRKVFGFIDGRRPAGQVIDLSRLGEFEACKSLVHLIDEGYIAPVKEVVARPEPDAGSIRKRVAWGPLIGRVALNLGVLVGLGLAVAALPLSREQIIESGRQLGHDYLARARTNRLQVIAAALEVYRVEQGQFPESLDAVVEAGLVSQEVLEMPDGEPVEYLTIGLDYDLR